MTKDEALKMAIEALEESKVHLGSTKHLNDLIQACKEALERPTNMVAVPADQLEKMQQEVKQLRKQPSQEPVAWIYEWEDEKAVKLTFHPDSKAKVIPLYTHPAPSWQGLSDDENYMGFAARTIPDDQGNFMHVEVLKVTVDGKFIWHPHADELIKNCEDLALKHVLQALKEKNT